MSNISRTPSSTIRPTHTSNFLEVMETPYFVDKSLMIETVVKGCAKNIYITAPPKFGKSVNLDMVRRFFDAEEDNRSKFEKLKIKDYPDIIDQHCGKYAVLWIDFSWFNVRIDSYENAIIALRQITHRTYKQYEKILSTSDELKSERKICKLWCDEVLFEDLSECQVGGGIANLAVFLHQHFKKDVVVLVDEFDAICRNAMVNGASEREMTRIIRYYSGVFAVFIKSMMLLKPFVYKAIFTGSIAATTCTGQSGLNNVVFYKFLEDYKFVDYYGILLQEFDELLEKPQYSKLRDQRDDALSFYNGYQFEDRKKILCTYSVVNYLFENSTEPNLPLKSYWSGCGAVTGFSHAWKKERLQLLLREMINGENVNVFKIARITPSDFANLQLVASASQTEVSPLETDVFLVYLQQLGYLRVVRKGTHSVTMSIPNEEIRSEFKSLLT